MSYYVNKSHLQLDPGNTRINFLIEYNLKKKKKIGMHAHCLSTLLSLQALICRRAVDELKLSRWSPNVCFERNLLLCIPSPLFDEETEFVMEWCHA